MSVDRKGGSFPMKLKSQEKSFELTYEKKEF